MDLEQQISTLERRRNADDETSSSSEADPDADATADNDETIDFPDGSPSGFNSTGTPRPGTWDPPSRRSPSIAAPESIGTGLTNPLSTGQSTFVSANHGRTFYLGTSSNWSFTRRLLSVMHEHVYRAPIQMTTQLFDGSAYDLGWDGYRHTANPGAPTLPTIDHAIYLINAVKFHCGQIFHLFDDDSFMKQMYDFYASSTRDVGSAGLWYIHFLLILAFGKVFVTRRTVGKKPPGSEYFVKALQLLPDVSVLSCEPILSTEILCCTALYLQALDFRHSAYNFIGQAMRIALAEGMHTDMPQHHLGESLVERCRRIWWTVYTLDRQMTSLMGLPQSIHDDDIHLGLPNFSGSPQRTAALNMQIKLSQVIATINRTIYGADGRLNRKFLVSTKNALARIAGLTDEAREQFPLHLDKTSSGISRTSAHLHLLYHQCIVLATRPLLFCFLKMRLKSLQTCKDALTTSPTSRNLIHMCIESSQKMVDILNCLQEQGLLESFLPFDLESVVVSTENILLGPTIDPSLGENREMWIQKAYGVISAMILDGNTIAQFRGSELRQLDDMLGLLAQGDGQNMPQALNSQAEDGFRTHPTQMPSIPAMIHPNHQPLYPGVLPSPISGVMDGGDLGHELTTAQITNLANSIDTVDAEWMSQTILEHNLW